MQKPNKYLREMPVSLIGNEPQHPPMLVYETYSTNRPKGRQVKWVITEQMHEGSATVCPLQDGGARMQRLTALHISAFFFIYFMLCLSASSPFPP